jgi:hypothetical protein
MQLGQEKAPNMPADAGQVFMLCKEEDGLEEHFEKKCCSGMGKMLHMMYWSIREILNPVQELSRFMKTASQAFEGYAQVDAILCQHS